MAQPPLLIQEGNSDSRFVCMTARTTKCKIGDVNADSIAHNIRENGQSPERRSHFCLCCFLLIMHFIKKAFFFLFAALLVCAPALSPPPPPQNPPHIFG